LSLNRPEPSSPLIPALLISRADEKPAIIEKPSPETGLLRVPEFLRIKPCKNADGAAKEYRAVAVVLPTLIAGRKGGSAYRGKLRAACGANHRRRQGVPCLSQLLRWTDFQVLASAPGVDQLPRIDSQRHKAVLLILDAGRDLEAALRQVRAFTAIHEAGRIAVVQGTLRWPDVVSFFQAGAHACFPESVAAETFLKSLELVMLGETLVPSTLLASVPSHGLQSPPPDDCGVHLSPQEERVLGSLIDGHPNKVIARELRIADATVKIHVKSILRKLRVDNRTQAAAWAMSRGSLDGPQAEGSPEGPIDADDQSSSHVADRSTPSSQAQEPASPVNGPLTHRRPKACAVEAKLEIVAPADRGFTQRWRLLPSERRTLEEQERRDEFLAKMHRLRQLREARDAKPNPLANPTRLAAVATHEVTMGNRQC
jgi:DNA-binding NarL/FixJ family response regulator